MGEGAASKTPKTGEPHTEYQRLIQLAVGIAYKTPRKAARTTLFTPFQRMGRVRDRVLLWGAENDEISQVCMTAYLHCIFDHFVIGPRALREQGVPGDVVDALKLLYWRKDRQTFKEHLEAVRSNDMACVVKTAVILEDLSAGNVPVKRVLALARGLIYLLEDPEGGSV